MNALQPSFMLLPNFSFLPDREVLLGTILSTAKDTKLPDPRRPLRTSSIAAPTNPSTQEFMPWTWDSEKQLTGHAGVWADLSLFSMLGGGIGGGQGQTDAIMIKCDRLVQTTFVPDAAFIARAVSDDTISRILKKITRPSVYMVTGLMVAHGAGIEVKKSKQHGGGAHASVDFTQTGVPVNTGVGGGFDKTQNSTLAQLPKEPFVLAYQLIRIRKKLDGSLRDDDENQWALFHGDEDEETNIKSLMSDMQTELTTPETIWDDE